MLRKEKEELIRRRQERERREGLMFRKEMEELKLETTGQGREMGMVRKRNVRSQPDTAGKEKKRGSNVQEKTRKN